MTVGGAGRCRAVSRHVLRHFSDQERLPFPDLFWSGKGGLSQSFPWIREIDEMAYLCRYGICLLEATLTDVFSCGQKVS